MYQPRTYRTRSEAEDLVSFGICVAQSDLRIQADCDLTAEALDATRRAYQLISHHLQEHEQFSASLEPLQPPDDADALVLSMYYASRRAGVGPMAAVAGATAEYVGRHLLRSSRQVIVENGGDIFLSTHVQRIVAIYAGDSPLNEKVGLIIPAGQTLGVCTSSGTVGHSLSLGRADAAVVVADDTVLADAVATALGNRVATPSDIDEALAWAQDIEGLRGALVICGMALGIWGEFEICPVQPEHNST